MDAMTMAKKQVLQDLISDMHKKMLAMGQSPDAAEMKEGESAAEESAESEGEEAAEQMPKPAMMPPKKGVSITLAAIKKGSDATKKMPSNLEAALMGKDEKKKKG
jgi:hypothetical protein